MNKMAYLLVICLGMSFCPIDPITLDVTGSEIEIAYPVSLELQSQTNQQQADRRIRPKTAVLNVRAAADKNSFTIGTVVKENEYSLLRDSGEWLLIRISPTKTGWVLAQAVEVIEPKPEIAYTAGISSSSLTRAPDQNALPRQAQIQADLVNLRTAPDKASPTIGVLEKNETVTLLQKNESWYQVLCKDKQGWLPLVAIDGSTPIPPVVISPRQSISHPQSKFMSLAKWGAIGATMLCSAGAVFYYQRGNKTYSEYEDAYVPSDAADFYQKTLRYDKKRNQMYWAAGASAGTAIVLHLLRWQVGSGQKTTVHISPDPRPCIGALISIHF